MVTTGMVCAGGFALASVPVAATSYVLILGLGSAAGLGLSDHRDGVGVGLMLLTYSAIVIYSVWTYAQTLGARMVAEARADRQNEVIGLLLRDFEDHASDLLWELDASGHFAHVSQRLASALALPPARLRQVSASALLRRLVPASDDSRAALQGLRQQIRRQAAFRDRVISLASATGPTWWSLSARPLCDERGRLVGWRGVAADITDRQLAHRRLSWLAHNDALTGLVNRVQFRELLHTLLQGPAGSAPPLAVISIDLDGFKQVNDTRGHAAGDQLLQTFGQRLLSVARRSDTVARLGGDEFAMVARGSGGVAEVCALLDRLLAALDATADAPTSTASSSASASLRASIGVAMAPGDGGDVDTLMNHADIALYAAKAAGGNRYCFFHSALAEGGRRRTVLADALRGAVARSEFHLVFQPQVSTRDGQVCGFEALLRWQHPTQGAVSPAEFISVAEGAGLMPEIGDWVLFEACRQAATWPRDIKVAINVSATQLGGDGFVERVQQAARGLRAGRVALEITESALIDDGDAAVATLQALRGKGFCTALDDFGTGYSALGYLRRFPFDTLKIDQSFVRDLSTDGEAVVIVDTILAMSRALRMTTIAEGVETVVEAAMLTDRGCGALQGYLISRPIPGAAIPGFLADWAGRRAQFSARLVALSKIEEPANLSLF